MILPSSEALLMAAVTGLYLYDSALLMHVNEGMFEARRGGWVLRFGTEHFQLCGKDLLLPNPLTPHRPIYRLAWQLEGGASRSDRDWTTQRAALQPLARGVWGIAAGLFLLLPLGLFTRLGEPVLLAALLLVYGSIIASAVWLWRHRSDFALSGRSFAALAFEVLACPPFALNLVRRLSRETPVSEDMVSAARRLLTVECWQRARPVLVARIDQEIVFAGDDGERVKRLASHRGILIEEAS